MNVNNSRIIELPKFLDARGNLSFVEQQNHIPFEIKRTYWIYDVPGGENRGGHAFKKNDEFIIALSGAFDVIVDDGKNKQIFTLNRSYYGLYVPAGLWREIKNFSTNIELKRKQSPFGSNQKREFLYLKNDKFCPGPGSYEINDNIIKKSFNKNMISQYSDEYNDYDYYDQNNLKLFISKEERFKNFNRFYFSFNINKRKILIKK